MKRKKTLEQKTWDRERAIAGRKRLPPVVQGRILAAEGITLSPRCATLLRAILEQTTWGSDQWIFDGVVGVVAQQAGCSTAQANRCVARFVELGILAPTKVSNGCGKPKVYLVRAGAEASTEPWPEQRGMVGRKRLPPVIRSRILAADGLTLSPRCTTLLRAILEQTTWGNDQWVFDGVVGVVAQQAGCSTTQAKRCVARFVESGILVPTKVSNGCGKPKVYIVHLPSHDTMIIRPIHEPRAGWFEGFKPAMDVETLGELPVDEGDGDWTW